jgi:hypothetical protein
MLKFPISILSIMGEIIINNLSILDHKNDTLIFIDQISTSIYNSTNLFTSKTKLNSLKLSGGIVKLNKYKGRFNYKSSNVFK